MNAIQLACYSLIVSAFILAGMLIVQLGDRFQNEARGEMVITREDFTLLTAKTRTDEEALFVLDNTTGRLLIYRTSLANNEIELIGGTSMPDLFGRQ